MRVVAVIDLSRRWIEYAECGSSPTELFFTEPIIPGGRAVPKKTGWDVAKAICGRCHVMPECRRDTLGETHGVWGGLDPVQRAELRSRRGADLWQASNKIRKPVAEMIIKLKRRGLDWTEVARLMGLSVNVCHRMYDWGLEDRKPVTTVHLPKDEEAHAQSA